MSGTALDLRPVLDVAALRRAGAWALFAAYFGWLGTACHLLAGGFAALGADVVLAHLLAVPAVALFPFVGWAAAGAAAVLAAGWPPLGGLALAVAPLGLLWASLRLGRG